MQPVWLVLISGMIGLHLANEPDVAFADGRFTTLVEPLTTMFVARYGAG